MKAMHAGISDNTKAILLLTVPLIVGKNRRIDDPLTQKQYNKLARHLRNHGQEPTDLLGSDMELLLCGSEIGLPVERIERLLKRGFLLSQAIEHWQSRGIWIVSRADVEYPYRVKTRLADNAPPVLFGCGDMALLENGGLAVVGSRNASDEVLSKTEEIGRLAAESSCTVISGAARGVDRAAMNGALTEGGTAVGVLAEALENFALSRDNREMLMEDRLLLISPYDPKARFNVGNAMQRNKLVYALSDVGLVMESDKERGGTWAGAVEQLRKLQNVPIYVYVNNQGDISTGLRALQRMGARRWPNPRNSYDFDVVLKDKSVEPKREDATQESLPGLEREKQSMSYLEQAGEGKTSPASILFAKVEQLLGTMDMPLKESDIVDRLNVNKTQARAWLNQLVLDGKYKRLKRPVRFHRIT